MIWKSVLLLSLSALYVLADEHHATSEQKIKKNIKKHPEGHHDEHKNHEEYEWSYPSFEFSYKVHDPHTKDIKGQHVVREGDKADGVYWLIQPDGYKRTVKYHADKHTGFNADVKYSIKHDHHEGHHESHHEEEEKKEEHHDEGETEEKKEEHVEEKKEEKEPSKKEDEEGRSHSESRAYDVVYPALNSRPIVVGGYYAHPRFHRRT